MIEQGWLLPGGSTTSKKLWLGFGTLTALLVLSSLTIIVRQRSIEGQVDAMANVDRSRSAGTRQLEINRNRQRTGLFTTAGSADSVGFEEDVSLIVTVLGRRLRQARLPNSHGLRQVRDEKLIFIAGANQPAIRQTAALQPQRL